MALTPGIGPEDPLPEGFGIRLDPDTRRSADGCTLLGGSPLRLFRLSGHGAKLLAGLRSGAPAAGLPGRRLARRLCDAGMAHPLPPAGRTAPGDIACVIPVRDDPEGLAALLASLPRQQPQAPAEVVIVEDGSRHPDKVVDLAERWGARLIRRDVSAGPAAARNDGWRATTAPVVAFLDADTVVGPEWPASLTAHFDDPTVAAVAPRVRAPAAQHTNLGRFERACSPLDMGAWPGYVVPRGRVPYVPSAALLFRREALEALDGFDEKLRVGEDVDLVWRAVAGGRFRYEPSVVVLHRNRPSWAALGRQRFVYGTSAAPLAVRHPAATSPLEIAPWSLAAWAAAVLGGRRGGWAALTVTVGAILRLRSRLADRIDAPLRNAPSSVKTGGAAASVADRIDAPLCNAARIVAEGHLSAGRWTAVALRRVWLPLLAVAALWPPGRRVVLAALVTEPLVSWAGRRPAMGFPTWAAAHLFSDAAYCAGVWRGALRERSAAALRPRFTGRQQNRQSCYETKTRPGRSMA